MKNNYNRVILIFIILMIISLGSNIYCYKKCEFICTISGNVFAGLITGFTIFIITNIKNSTIYKYEKKINNLTNIIDESRKCEITIYKFNSQNNIAIIDLINLYSDLSNCFDDIYQYNSNFFINNDINYDLINNECISKIGELSDKTYDINMNKDDYMNYGKDLSKKLSIIFRLRILINKDLERFKQDKDSLFKSIF